MKILIVNKFLYPNGGSETYIFKIGEQLVQMGHEVEYFGMEHEGRIVGNRAESYTSNMDFHSGKLQRLLYPFKIIYSSEARKKIRKVLEQFAPDVVHLNNFNFQLTPSILYEIRSYEKKCKKHIQIVYTAHDSQLVCPNHLMQNPVTGARCSRCLEGSFAECMKNRCIHGSKVKSILGALEGSIYKRLKTYAKIDTIICPSQFLKDKLDTSPVLKTKTVVMHNFVDRPSMPDMEKEDYVLYFGRYSKEKGIETLTTVCKELPDIPFRFAGAGPMQELVEGCPNIQNLGFLSGDSLYETIAKARITIFPSECYENCPFTVMESLICKTPVIGANLGGIPELLEEKVTGELFESGNQSELKEKIVSLWNNRKQLEQYTQNCAEVHFDSLQEYCEKLLIQYGNK